MSNETIGQEEPDLKALDEYLMSDESPENCMQISDLDGFLTAIVVGPDPQARTQRPVSMWQWAEIQAMLRR